MCISYGRSAWVHTTYYTYIEIYTRTQAVSATADGNLGIGREEKCARFRIYNIYIYIYI